MAKRYLQSFGISLLTVLFFILLIDGSDQLNFFSSNGLDANKAILNIFLRIPMLTLEAMALIIMLSSILTFSWLSNSNEIAILKASGKKEACGKLVRRPRGGTSTVGWGSCVLFS